MTCVREKTKTMRVIYSLLVLNEVVRNFCKSKLSRVDVLLLISFLIYSSVPMTPTFKCR